MHLINTKTYIPQHACLYSIYVNLKNVDQLTWNQKETQISIITYRYNQRQFKIWNELEESRTR